MSGQDPLIYSQPPFPKGDQLKMVAVFLIVIGGIAILVNAFMALSNIVQLSTGHVHVPPGVATRPGSETGFYLGFYGSIGVTLLAIPLSILMIIGAIAMLTRRSYRLAYTGAILAIIPFTAACCCIAALPFGIWALVLLHKPEVKNAFH